MTKLSVCVPRVERPQNTQLPIESLLAQDHADRKLSITNDSMGTCRDNLSGYGGRIK